MILYRLTITALAPLVLALLIWRVARGRETWGDLAQRLGGGAETGGDGSAIWVHGASNGELTSARRLIEGLRRQNPARAMVVTTNTTTARDLVRGWQMPSVTARLAPLDYRPVLARFRRHWQPAVLIVLENELWANRIVTARAPVAVVAARMSARSARRWAFAGGLMRRVLANVSYLSAQDAASAQRFVSLGLETARAGPVISLKPGIEMAAPPAGLLANYRNVFTREDTILAASTHAGEDQTVLAAFARARAERPALKLIVAPRHPHRAPDIAALIAAAGLPFARRSQGADPDAETAVYLADTLGEMPLWYALAGVCFVGGSLVDKGGHTPFEPALAGSSIVHGPHVANFAPVYTTLDAAGAAVAVSGVDDLAAALRDLSPEGQARMTRAATTVVSQSEADLAPVLNRLQSLIDAPR
ncbi:MAG: 3-deoxy-D-manno-octulosonic acid transferase [Rhodobacter sp.]|nr:3-deoxy-D-manno-octulosonic acid transferase [Rhodobacter sp.]